MAFQSFFSNLVCVVLLCGVVDGDREASSKCSSDNRTLYEFKDETLNGEHFDYSKYKGDVVLMVNVATF